MTEEIRREYFAVKDIAEAFHVTRVHIMNMVHQYQIPSMRPRSVKRQIRGKYKIGETGAPSNMIPREQLWKVYVVVLHRKSNVSHRIIPSLIKALQNERDSITAVCTALLGESRPGDGEEVKELREMGVSEREAENPVSKP